MQLPLYEIQDSVKLMNWLVAIEEGAFKRLTTNVKFHDQLVMMQIMSSRTRLHA